MSSNTAASLFPSEFATQALFLPNHEGRLSPLSFAGREYLIPVYDTPAQRLLLKCARQTEKSTLIGNKLLTYSVVRDFLRSLYVSPRDTQTVVFSKERLAMPINTSPYISQKATGKNTSDNVYYKQFSNYSSITLRSAFLDADAVRGIATDNLVIDEIQDILYDNVPIIEECQSHSPLKLRTYTGTPKSFDNTIEYYWSKYSTQFEWMMPCDRCGLKGRRTWSMVEYDTVGLKGIICKKCGGLLNPKQPGAGWYSMRSSEWLKDPPSDVGIPMEGYRIPQPIVSWLTWKEILDKKARYSITKFNNEVLGLSHDSGEKLIRLQALKDSSDSNIMLNDPELLTRYGPLFMGIDWSGGGENGSSLTCVTIGGYVGGKYYIFYMKAFEGAEAEEDAMMAFIFHLIDKYKIHLVGTDYGGGLHTNDKLIRRYGVEKIIRFQYVGTKKFYYDSELARFMLNRTECMMALINAVNRTDTFRFPRWESWEHPFAAQFMSLYSEWNKANVTMTVTKTAGKPDDLVHSMLYSFFASMLAVPRPDIISPDKER